MNLHPAIRALLLPASWVYGLVVRLRAWLYRTGIVKQKRLKGVVISVGNLTVGGTGKTPMVLWLVEALHREGKRVGILTRGYRGVAANALARLPAPLRQNLPAGQLNDEVALLAWRLLEKAHFGVGADRYTHGRALEKIGVEWFVLDDGFQHLALARDADILLIDATDPLGGGALLPAGRLREPVGAIARADLVVVTRASAAPALESVVRRYSQVQIFYAQPQLEGIFPAEPTPQLTGEQAWRGKRAFLFCAIGNPAAFFRDARGWGLEIVGELAFPDHHHFRKRDAADIEKRARDAGAQMLLCTEKDRMNLRDVNFESLPLFVCRISMIVDRPNEFWRELQAVIQRKREGKRG